MKKIDAVIQDYLRKRKKLVEDIFTGNAPDERAQDELFAFEQYLRDSGYDPDQIFMESAAQSQLKAQGNGEYPKVISQEIRLIKPVVPKEQGFFKSAEKIIETQPGCLTRVVAEGKYLVACGSLVDEKDIAGRCDSCGLFECKEHWVNCFEDVCGKGLCVRCRIFLELVQEPGRKAPFCEEHARRRGFDFDTWEYMRKAGEFFSLEDRQERWKR